MVRATAGRVRLVAELAYHVSTGARKKAMLRIPESHSLYLCPNSCARRYGIRAFKSGLAGKVSFLRFSQADVAAGSYEQRIEEAIGRVLDLVKPTPRAITLHVNCIDDFLGTDDVALLDSLARRFPSTKFVLSRVNPIAADIKRNDSKAQGIHSRLYDLLDEPATHDAGLTLLGCFESIIGLGEFSDIARDAGFHPLRDLPSCATFSDYQDLARSSYAVSLSFLGDAALRRFEERFGMRGLIWPATYDLDEIERMYERFGALVGKAIDCAPYRARAEESVRRAVDAVGARPVIVDSSSSMRPFTLACNLADMGFNVAAVMALHVKGEDARAAKDLSALHPEIVVVKREGHEALQGYAQALGDTSEAIAIGVDATTLLCARRSVDMYHDEGHFGFQGVELLMEKLTRAAVGEVA